MVLWQRKYMKYKSLFLSITFLVSTLLFSGCATLSPAEIASASFDPVPANIEDLIQRDAGTRLMDPYSAVYEFGTPRRGFAQEGFAVGGKKRIGYIIPIEVNAKNEYGAYTGYKTRYYLWSEGGLYDVTALKLSGMAKYID
jgi:hypothetical protein